MALRHLGFIDLPAHLKAGGFDHAAVHQPTGQIYVAHTANDAVDVIDARKERYLFSIPGLTGVAGALVAEPDLVFTSNRGENTLGIFTVETPLRVEKVNVGIHPNGLAYDPRRARLLSAHVGDPSLPGSCTVSIVDIPTRKRVADIAVAGRTRWAVHDPIGNAFHVNIADPPQIAVVDPGYPGGVRRVVSIPHAGPHGLDIDVARRRLFCACDAGVLVEVDTDSGKLLARDSLAGVPDVVFLNVALGRLYVAIGDPGVIQVFDTAPLRHRETVTTEPGAHTLSFDAARNVICAFLPLTHRAAVFADEA